jgi:hypothetical protein
MKRRDDPLAASDAAPPAPVPERVTFSVPERAVETTRLYDGTTEPRGNGTKAQIRCSTFATAFRPRTRLRESPMSDVNTPSANIDDVFVPGSPPPAAL